MSRNIVDVLLAQLGTGKWNLLHAITTGFATGLPAAHALSGAFVVPRLHHTCRMDSDSVIEPNYNTSNINNCTYSTMDKGGEVKEELCLEWDFDSSQFTRTATSELQLVCQRDYVRAMYMSLYMMGVLVASPTVGYLADKFGRKKIFVIGYLGFVLLSNISGWLPNVTAVLICRFLIGIMHVSVVKISYILGIESCSPDIRSFAGILLYFPWTLYAIFFGGLGYFIRDWRWLMTVSSLPSLLLIPPLWFLDESIHWLVVKGQHDKALVVLKKAARWNKKSIPSDEDILSMLKSNSTTQKAPLVNKEEDKQSWASLIKRNVSDLFILFRTPRLRTISLVFHLDFFVIDMVYYGLAFSGGIFSVDIFTYMILLGLVEIPSRTLLIPIVSHFGRKIPQVSSLLFTGVILLCIGFIPTDLQWLIVTCTLIGRMTISIASSVNYLYGSEIFPTEVRTRGISSSFMMSRVGSSIAPFITEYLGHAYQWAPSVVFGGGAFIGGLATMFLWETRGLTLPDTIEFLENNDPRMAAKRNQEAKQIRTKPYQGKSPDTLDEEQMHLQAVS